MKQAIFQTITFLSLLVAGTNSYAQIEKGKWLAGIGFSYGTNKFNSTQTNREQKNSSSDVSISIGRFLTDKLLIGTGFSYSNDYSNSVHSSDNYYKSNANVIGLNTNISLFIHLEKRFYYNPGVNINYSKSKSIFKTKQPGFQEDTNENKGTIISTGLYPIQFSYLLKNKFLFQGGFGEIKYAYINTKTDIPSNSDAVGKSNGFNIDFSPNISNIGISIIF